MRDAPEDLPIDWISQDPPKSLNPHRCLLIDGPRAPPEVAARAGWLFARELPFGSAQLGAWEFDRLPIFIERDPHLDEVVEITAQTKTDTGPLECLYSAASSRSLHRPSLLRCRRDNPAR